MAEPFDGLPTSDLYLCTVNFTLCPANTVLSQISESFRLRLNKLFSRLSPGAIVRGKFDLVLKRGDQLNFELQQSDLPDELDADHLPSDILAMVHAHFVVFHPTLSREEVSAILREAFPGKNRVCVRSARDDVVHDNGSVTQGVQGYLEYASLEKVELAFGADSVDAVLQYARFDATWTRANKNIRFGKRSETTDSLIDQGRAYQLQANNNYDWLGKDYDKLEFHSYWPQHLIRGGFFLYREICIRRSKLDHHKIVWLLPVSYNSPIDICNSPRAKKVQPYGIIGKRTGRYAETSGKWISGYPP